LPALANLPKIKMPHKIKPMLATLSDEVFDNENWVFEIKWDGYRAIAEIEEGKVELYSRNNISFNEKFKPVTETLSEINHNVIFDGEIVSVDSNGISKFQLLQNFQKTGEGNLTYYIFDIIYLDGYDLKNLPLIERKGIIQKILPTFPNIKYSDHIEKEGKLFYKIAEEKKVEGILAKNKQSRYQINKRSAEWLKLKIKIQQEAVICGFTKPKGSRKNIGALILGAYQGNELIYIGHSGGGFTEDELERLKRKFEPLVRKTCPFKEVPKTNTPATWVEPKLVCEISFSEWTEEGLMRHPIYLGLREDKKPAEVVKEISGNNVSASQPEDKTSGDKEVEINNHKIKLTNLNKIYWPVEGFTKRDLIDYYRKAVDYILPYLIDRPQSLNRYPNGINGKSFYQKDINQKPPDWVQTKKIYSESIDKEINFMICNDEETLVYMANLGCIEINPWFSRITNLDNPDYFVIDLDPEDISFEKVIETALVVKDVFDNLGIESFCKTSGSTGLHIYVPLGAKYEYNVAKDFAHLIGKIVNNRIPEFTSLERSPSKRKKKVYLDYLQNRSGQTLAAPYSVRPRPGATVATPLYWEEVKEGLSPKNFTIFNIPDRLNNIGDIFENVLGKGIDINKSIKKLEEIRNKS
jgi:bifunctional non-homologous end joining protein LigD